MALWSTNLWNSDLWAPGLWEVDPATGGGGSVMSVLRKRKNNMATNTSFNVLNVVGATVTQTTQDYKNEYGLGGEVFLNVTSIGTGNITLKVQGKDLTSGVYYDVLVGAAVAGNGMVRYQIFPGATVTANSSVNDVFPLTWRVVVTANNANPVTYSVGVLLVG
jgi:hypothetical protein